MNIHTDCSSIISQYNNKNVYLVEYLILNIQKKKKYYYHSKLDIQKRYVTSLFTIILRYNNKKWKLQKKRKHYWQSRDFEKSKSPILPKFHVGMIHSTLHVQFQKKETYDTSFSTLNFKGKASKQHGGDTPATSATRRHENTIGSEWTDSQVRGRFPPRCQKFPRYSEHRKGRDSRVSR